MEKDIDLVVVGEFNADLILTGDVQPVFGQVEKLIDDAVLTIGSSACICACGAAKLGLHTALIAKRGADPFGDFVDADLRGKGVNTHAVVIDNQVKTGLSVILNRGSDRAILTHPGSIPLLDYAEIDFEMLRRSRHLHLSSYYLLERLRSRVPDLFRQARAFGLSVSLDTNYDPRRIWQGEIEQVLPLVDVFLPNETELFAVSGERTVPAALARLERPGLTIAVKQGSRGACARQDGRTVEASSISVEVADTVGAGDSFDAGFLCGYLQGWDLPRSLALACACGALSTRAAGGTGSQASLEEALMALESV